MITPRWEWRTFGSSFPTADRVFGELPDTRREATEETYFLVLAGDTVKVRHELIDIKRLRDVDDARLERWEPVLKAPFPLSGDQLAAVTTALRVDPLAGTPVADQTALEALLAERGVRAVVVAKDRWRGEIDGCAVELTDIVVGDDRRTIRTVAVESTDAPAVLRVVERLGLAGRRNTSYPVGLARLLAGPSERLAVIDVGTNSVKFHVAERSPRPPGRSTVVDRAEVTRLGEGLTERGAIGDAPLERTIEAIRGMVGEARELGVAAIFAVGTAGLRQASDRAAVLAAIRERTGVDVEVIAGEEEARLAFLATMARHGRVDGSVVVFDTGGGSTQFTLAHGDRIDRRFSLDVGAVLVTERFGLDRVTSSDTIDAVRADLADRFASLEDARGAQALIGMGGAITNLTAIHHRLATYDPTVVDGAVLGRDMIDREIETFRSMDAPDRRSIVGLQPARAEVILAGACIVRAVMDRLGLDRLTVSDRGLRHGVLADRADDDDPARDATGPEARGGRP